MHTIQVCCVLSGRTILIGVHVESRASASLLRYIRAKDGKLDLETVQLGLLRYTQQLLKLSSRIPMAHGCDVEHHTNPVCRMMYALHTRGPFHSLLIIGAASHLCGADVLDLKGDVCVEVVDPNLKVPNTNGLVARGRLHALHPLNIAACALVVICIIGGSASEVLVSLKERGHCVRAQDGRV